MRSWRSTGAAAALCLRRSACLQVYEQIATITLLQCVQMALDRSRRYVMLTAGLQRNCLASAANWLGFKVTAGVHQLEPRCAVARALRAAAAAGLQNLAALRLGAREILASGALRRFYRSIGCESSCPHPQPNR